jgi:hypothetical protein
MKPFAPVMKTRLGGRDSVAVTIELLSGHAAHGLVADVTTTGRMAFWHKAA